MSYVKLAQKHGYKVDVVTRAIKETGLDPSPVKRAAGKTSLKLPAYWREPLKNAGSKVLILNGPQSSLSVRKRQLIVFDAGREISYMPGIPPFENVLIEAHGFQVTGEALKWLARHKIGLFVMSEQSAALPMLAPPPAKRAKLRLSQYAAFHNPLPLASAIIAQKILTSREYGFLGGRQAREYVCAVKNAADLQSVLLIEGAAAQDHFAQLRKKLVFRGLGNDWPETWDRWDSRIASLDGPSPRNALHPFNAILNYAYTVAAGQIERALSAWGFDTAIGFLHALNDYRASLAYDALELFRATIDFRILSFTTNSHFRRKDFILAKNGVVRLTPEIARVVAGRALATKRDLNDLCAWLEDEVSKHAPVRDILAPRYGQTK